MTTAASAPVTRSAGPAPTPQRRDTREQRGWYVYDWANSAFQTTVVTVFLGPYLTTITQNAAGPRRWATSAVGCSWSSTWGCSWRTRRSG